LLLPLDSPDFRNAAEAVRQGFFAAHTATASRVSVDVRRTDASPQRILDEYAAAVAAGTRVVVGPLTRSGVTAIAAAVSGDAAVLALNQPETAGPLPPRFYTFGLAIEAESRAAARAAFEQGLRTAAVLSSGTPLARRGRDAFVEEWQALGGRVAASLEASVPAGYGALRAPLSQASFDVAFLAAEANAARLLRPYLRAGIPVFATSQINDGRADSIANLDMNGVRFVDMPWMVQAGSQRVVGFPRPQGLPADLERLYALGIDAQRIASQLVDGRTGFTFDGVTGRIAVRAGGAIERVPVLATFRDGAPVGE
jgi:outer membrane PBP1 activator LpoA protein